MAPQTTPISLGCAISVLALLAGSFVWDRVVNGNSSSIPNMPRAPTMTASAPPAAQEKLHFSSNSNSDMIGRTKLANATHIEAIFGSAVVVPEFVDPALLSKVEALQLGYAGQMQVPSGCRARLLQQLSTEGGVAVLVGGLSEERAGSDTEILFRQESNFIYLSGFDHPGAQLIVGLDAAGAVLRAGEAWLFVPRGNAVWQGRTETLDDFKAKYDVTDVFWIEDFDA